MQRNDLLNRLERLDEDASLIFKSDKRFKLVIVGGGALVVQKHLSRATNDIDVLEVSTEINFLLDKYDINSRVKAYLCNFPYNYEDRMSKIEIGGRRIDFYAISLEDIVISKLYSHRSIDQHDIYNEAILKALNWEILDKIALDENETKLSSLNDRTYSEFRQSYEDYKRRHLK
jgi:hypothetical protein